MNIHDNLSFMENDVSVISEERNDIENQEFEPVRQNSVLLYSAKAKYRLIRKKFSAFFREHKKNSLTDILYITDGNFSKDYILALQKQYPNKTIKVLIPSFGNLSKLDKSIATLEYNIQNKRQIAKLYKHPQAQDNIETYIISSKVFSGIEKPTDLYKIHNIIHYSICARLAAKKLKPNLIHSENIPFFMGLEFNKINSNSNIKVLQTIHDFSVLSDIEPFWAAINILDKKGISKLSSDKIMKKNIAALFGVKNVNSFSKLKQCLEYLYENFEQYRKSYTKDEDTNENILIDRLNKRVLELFPMAFKNKSYNPIYYSIKSSKSFAVHSKPEKYPDWMNELPNCNYIPLAINENKRFKIAHPFNINNYRYYREYNKQYLIKEFAEKQIKTNFTDVNLFGNDEVKIYGYLDSFYKGTLLFATFDNLKELDIRTIVNSVLKCFEYKKNIQVIFNAPTNFDNQYLKSMIDFLEKQPSLNGKWLFVEGEINLPQFMAASDMILLPNSEVIGVENILYTAIKYGCIPITTNIGICGDIVIDIFDDMITGFGFKTQISNISSKSDTFTDALFKGLNFYIQNFTSWNLLIKNAISYDSSWNFELIEKYNNLYNKMI